MKSPLKLQVGDAIYVEWEDHYTDHDEWTDIEGHIDENPIIIKTAGFLVKESPKSYSVALLMYENNTKFSSTILILKNCVTKIKKLRVK